MVLAVDGYFAARHSLGTREELLSDNGLDSAGVANEINEALGMLTGRKKSVSIQNMVGENSI